MEGNFAADELTAHSGSERCLVAVMIQPMEKQALEACKEKGNFPTHGGIKGQFEWGLRQPGLD